MFSQSLSVNSKPLCSSFWDARGTVLGRMYLRLQRHTREILARNLVFFSLLMIFAIACFSRKSRLYLDMKKHQARNCIQFLGQQQLLPPPADDDDVSCETTSAPIPNSSIQKKEDFKGYFGMAEKDLVHSKQTLEYITKVQGITSATARPWILCTCCTCCVLAVTQSQYSLGAS